MRTTRLLALWAVMALALAACGGAGASTAASRSAAASVASQSSVPEVTEAASVEATAVPSEAATSEATSAASAGGEATSVNIIDFAFEPAEKTVAAGATVFFSNTGDAPHTATADDGSFDTDTIAAGDKGSLTFDTPGTFPYHCEIHPQMKATITVEG